MRKFIVDRIEGNIVVCEDDNLNIIEMRIDSILGDVKEGDVITADSDRYMVNKEETAKRKKQIEELMKGMWD